MRLEGTCRRGGKEIQPRFSHLSNNVRAAMSLSWPTGLRQFQSVAKYWLKRRRLQSGCAANNWRTCSRSVRAMCRPWMTLGSYTNPRLAEGGAGVPHKVRLFYPSSRTALYLGNRLHEAPDLRRVSHHMINHRYSHRKFRDAHKASLGSSRGPAWPICCCIMAVLRLPDQENHRHRERKQWHDVEGTENWTLPRAWPS